MQLQFSITLQNDDELIQKVDTAADGLIVINRFLLCRFLN